MKTDGQNAQIGTRHVIPVSLLVDERPCLVVGGGKVAARKAQLLLDAGAAVTVVSPELGAELRPLVEAGGVRHVIRRFAESDVAGARLAFAATNDAAVNRLVLAACRAHGVPGCAVDEHWPEGDFVTPATLRKRELTVAVSTSGRSCRRSRLIKENLERHMAMVETANLMVMGTSHHYLDVEAREPFHLVDKRYEETGNMLMHVWGIHEFLLLNTCNRVELVAVVARHKGVEALIRHVFGFDHLAADHFYLKRGLEAFGHVAVLSAGLMSQTPGENHIVAQVKEALDFCAGAGWAGAMMREWIDSALHVSKDIRQVTGPLLQATEIEDLCVDYLATECAGLEHKRVLVVGTGMVGTGLVQRFMTRYPALVCDWCYHLNRPEPDPAWVGRVKICTLNEVRDRLPAVDVVVCATGSSGFVIHQGHAPFFDQQKDVLLVDLAMPRNIAPALNGLTPTLRVVDLDDLKHWYRREQADLARIFELGQQTVRDHKDLYDKIIRHFQGGDTV